jgi:Flp pilus assembly pilin Flp
LDEESEMRALMRSFWSNEVGQDMAEYALLLTLIALVLVIAIAGLRGAIEGRFDETAKALEQG